MQFFWLNMVPVTMNITGGSSGWDIENTVKRLEIMNFMEFPAKGAFLFDEVLLDQDASETDIVQDQIESVRYKRAIKKRGDLRYRRAR